MKLSVRHLYYALPFILSLSVDSSCGLRILGIFPYPIKSHQVMHEELMKGLAEKGHRVDVYNHFPQKKKIPNYNDYSLVGSVPIFSNNVTYDFMKTEWSADADMMKSWYGDYGKTLCSLLDLPILQELLKNPPQDPPYDLFIFEVSAAYCFVPLGQLLNVPVIGSFTSPPSEWIYKGFGSPLNPATDVSVDLPYSTPMTFFQRLHNFFYCYSAVHSFNINIEMQDKQVEKYFGPGYPSVTEMHKNISLLLINHDMTLHGLKAFAPVIVPVGGLHIVDRNETLPKDLQKWLDESKDGFIYISFGSMFRIETMPKDLLDAFYKSFKNIAPVRVLMKIAKPEILPPGLPSNVLTQTWLQQTQVLKHKNIKAFVTHGGLMGTMESLYYAVPLIGIPLYYDQPSNIASFVKRKVAVSLNLNELTEESMTRAFNEILKNPIYAETMKKFSQKFKDRPMSPVDTAVYWVEYIHRYGKDALRSPVLDLPWWQVALLDIYAVLIVSASVIIYVAVLVFKKLTIFYRFQFCKTSKMKRS